MHVAKRDNDAAVVELDTQVSSGDRDGLDSLEDVCSGLAGQGVRCILLDMEGVQTAPSVFLATLASLQKRVHSLGGEIAVIHPTSRMRKLFRVTVMDRVIGLYGDERSALEAVHKHVEEMRAVLREELSSPQKLVRLKAGVRLARSGEEQGFDVLSEFLADEDPVVRLQATLSLAAIGGARVVAPLVRALSDKEYRVRMYAAEALGKIEDARAIEPLKAAVRFERNRNVIFKANQALDQLLRQDQARAPV